MIYATEQQVVVTVVLVVVVALVSLFTGIIWGHRRGMAEGAEEERWAREQAAARRSHPVYCEPQQARTLQSRAIYEARPDIPPEVAHEAWTAHEEQALTLANDRTLGGKLHDIHGGPGEDCWCGYVGHWPAAAAITTGEIQAITDEMDTWIAEHITAVPADYGQEDRRGRINVGLRQWCRHCQACTLSENCPSCTASGMACAACHRCAIHDPQPRRPRP